MSWLPTDQTKELIAFACIADKEARSDLAGGHIQSEDDYTSNFTGALRRILNSNSQTGLSATSFRLAPSDERCTGTDATIIITRHGESKVALFEAKWPRLSDPKFPWDYSQTSTGLSHFSDQLARQHKWQSRFAIFEMFYCEHKFGKQPQYLQSDGSSCVWHDDAHSFMSKRTDPKSVWSQGDLVSMLQSGNVGLEDILFPFCDCKRGEVLRMNDPKRIVFEFHLPPTVLAVQSNADDKCHNQRRPKVEREP